MRLNRYVIRCPFCGHENSEVYLEDSDGLMECEFCKKVSKHIPDRNIVKIPVYTEESLVKIFKKCAV